MLLSESLLLGLAGGSLGITLLVWERGTVKFLVPKSLPLGIPIDWRVLTFTAACSLAAGLLFGLAPALTTSRVDVNAGLTFIQVDGSKVCWRRDGRRFRWCCWREPA